MVASSRARSRGGHLGRKLEQKIAFWEREHCEEKAQSGPTTPPDKPPPACSRPACELTRARAGRRRRTLAVHRWDSVLRNMVTTSGRVLGLSARSGGQVLKQESRPERQHSDIAPPPSPPREGWSWALGRGRTVTVGRPSVVWLCGLDSYSQSRAGWALERSKRP